MQSDDTIRLLRECDAGVKMGVASIKEVQGYVRDKSFRTLLDNCRTGHEALGNEVQALLEGKHDDGKEPNPIAKGMSWVRTNVMLTLNESDHTIADLITDGCNMGVKSLNRYLNQYAAADTRSKDIARRLSRLEEQLTADIRQYL